MILTDAERELIVCLMEEAGEVVQACSKLLRHGPNSFHPMDPLQTSNLALLENEIADFNDICDRLCDLTVLYKHRLKKTTSNKDKYLHGRLLG